MTGSGKPLATLEELGGAGALKGKEHLAVFAVQRTRTPMLITDRRRPDNPIVFANPAFLKLTGYAEQEVVGRNSRFLQGPGTSPEAIAEISRAIAQGREIQIEILSYRKDGTSFWNQLELIPVRDDDGELAYCFASMLDVTELRRIRTLEATERRLLLEVDHRARNVLAVVSSIVRLSRSDDAALYAATIQQRVQALARAHTLLAQRGWKEVSLEELVRQQVAPQDEDRISISGPETMVSAYIVQPLALALHEMAVNAHRHGSLALPAGRLRVTWTQVGENGAFRLRWEELGGPIPSEELRPGFGAAMVLDMVRRQLRGELLHEWTPNGLVVDIFIPGHAAVDVRAPCPT